MIDHPTFHCQSGALGALIFYLRPDCHPESHYQTVYAGETVGDWWPVTDSKGQVTNWRVVRMDEDPQQFVRDQLRASVEAH